MPHALLLTVALLGQAGPGASPAAPATDDLRQQIETLVRQLESDERLKRDDAQEKLVRLGPAILDLLSPLVERATNADVKHRLEQVQAQLQAQQAREFAAARTVTLHAAAMPLSDVLAAIAQQSGNKVTDHRAQFMQEQTNPSLKVDFDNVPFWQALDRVLDQAQLTLYHYAGKDSLSIVARPQGEGSRESQAAYVGPFRLQATKISAERDLRRPERRTQVTVEVAWEPRFTPISLQQPFDQIEAIDDQGNALSVERGKGELEIPVQGGQTAVELPISFVSPPRSAAKLATLKGKLTAVVPSRVEAFQFDDILNKKNAELRKADATVTLEQVRKNRDVWEVRMRVRFAETFGSLESHRGWIYENEAYLLGPDKQPIHHGGFEKTRQAKDEVGLAYLFSLPEAAAAANYTFVYQTPAAILKLPIEYQIKDVELP